MSWLWTFLNITLVQMDSEDRAEAVGSTWRNTTIGSCSTNLRKWEILLWNVGVESLDLFTNAVSRYLFQEFFSFNSCIDGDEEKKFEDGFVVCLERLDG